MKIFNISHRDKINFYTKLPVRVWRLEIFGRVWFFRQYKKHIPQ